MNESPVGLHFWRLRLLDQAQFIKVQYPVVPAIAHSTLLVMIDMTVNVKTVDVIFSITYMTSIDTDIIQVTIHQKIDNIVYNLGLVFAASNRSSNSRIYREANSTVVALDGMETSS